MESGINVCFAAVAGFLCRNAGCQPALSVGHEQDAGFWNGLWKRRSWVLG